MVSFTGEAFRKKIEKLIEKLRAEDGFYLAHIEVGLDSWMTFFGNGYICFRTPLLCTEEVKQDTGRIVYRLFTSRLWSEDAQANMKWVPLPKAADLKPGRDKEHPVKCHLAATDMSPYQVVTTGEYATYPFAVQARYLKMALQLTTFSGQKDVRSVYNPLCLWAQDDEGNEICAVIMPIRE